MDGVLMVAPSKISLLSLPPLVSRKISGTGHFANGEALPVRRDPVGVRHPHTRYCSVPSKDDVAGKIDLGKIRQPTVGSLHDADVVNFQLPDNIDHPILAEGFPSQDVDTTRA